MSKELGDVDIKVTGMGGLINFEIEFIAKCFRDLGYEVVIDNAYADWKGDGPASRMSLEERIEAVKKAKHKKVFIEAKHIPWPG